MYTTNLKLSDYFKLYGKKTSDKEKIATTFKGPNVVPRPTLQNVIFHTILDDCIILECTAPIFKPLGTIFPKTKVGGGASWLVIIHVHVHVPDDVLYYFIKLTKINTEPGSNAA